MVWWSTWTTHGLAPLVLTRIVTGPSLAFTCPERLDKSNKYKCGGCSREVRALKQFSIYNAPNMLLVHLKRFRPGFFGKVNKFIEFGTSLELQLCLSRGCVERQASPEYDLYAVVVHIDMYNISSFGHYVCYVRTESGDWFLTNDASVTNVPEEEVLKQNAYMLLYKRRVPRVWEVMTEAEVAEEAEHAASAAGTASASAAASGDDDMLPPRRSLSAALADPTSADSCFYDEIDGDDDDVNSDDPSPSADPPAAPAGPQMCNGGCGFFAGEDQQGMCSKCFTTAFPDLAKAAAAVKATQQAAKARAEKEEKIRKAVRLAQKQRDAVAAAKPKQQASGTSMKRVPTRSTKVGRNDPCPCGSKKKYKNCHGKV
eukprot:m.222513 g.222513  ORF g.222513 m.222513 type:complete len:371 (+) comp18736_c0_seq1:113-1225(+)